MARSALGSALRQQQQDRQALLTPDERSLRASEAARQGIADFAATHGLSWGEARRRLVAARRAGRTPTTVFGD